MLKTNKGQALIEFVLILPIFLMLFLGIIDFGNILYQKNHLENVMVDVVDMISTDLTFNEVKNNIDNYYNSKLKLTITSEGKNTFINLSTVVNIYTPGLDLIISKPYKVETNRVIYNE